MNDQSPRCWCHLIVIGRQLLCFRRIFMIQRWSMQLCSQVKMCSESHNMAIQSVLLDRVTLSRFWMNILNAVNGVGHAKRCACVYRVKCCVCDRHSAVQFNIFTFVQQTKRFCWVIQPYGTLNHSAYTRLHALYIYLWHIRPSRVLYSFDAVYADPLENLNTRSKECSRFERINSSNQVH